MGPNGVWVEAVEIVTEEKDSFSALDHDQEVVVRIKVTKLVVAFVSGPQVRTEMDFAINCEIVRHWQILLQLGEKLLDRGHGQVARSSSGVALQEVITVRAESVFANGVLPPNVVLGLVGLSPNPNLIAPNSFFQ